MEGVDKVIGMLEKVAKHAPRPYHFVVLSDHGQSQGATFLQRYGKSLEDTVRDLMGGADGVAAATGNDEDWGPLNIFLSDLTRQSGFTASRDPRASVSGRQEDGAVSLGPTRSGEQGGRGAPELVVAGSGQPRARLVRPRAGSSHHRADGGQVAGPGLLARPAPRGLGRWSPSPRPTASSRSAVTACGC